MPRPCSPALTRAVALPVTGLLAPGSGAALAADTDASADTNDAAEVAEATSFNPTLSGLFELSAGLSPIALLRCERTALDDMAGFWVQQPL